MALGVAGVVGVTDRVARLLLASDVPLDRASLRVAAARLLEEEAPLAGPHAAEAVVDSVVGLGPVEPLLRDPAVSDILINGPADIWVERAGHLQEEAVTFPDAATLRAAVERVIAPLGLRLDRAAPAVDARLADGSRLHAVVSPAAPDGPIVAVRRFTEAVPDLAALIGAEAITPGGAALLRAAVTDRRNIVVSGGTGSGKTTLLNVLSKEVLPGERIVTIEDAAELRLTGHVVRLEARPANAEGIGAITTRTLLRHALRLRPDRIIVGEVRGSEALDMISALNTGHEGSMSTVHANSPEEALWRLETLALSGDDAVESEVVRRQLEAAVHLLVHTERRAGRRRVVRVAAAEGGRLTDVYSC